MTERYTHGHPAPVLQSHRWRTAANSCAYLLPELAPGAAVLDVGCGPGTITADLARRVRPGRVVGIDRAPEVIAVAAGDHRHRNLEFAPGDVYAIDHADGTFDVVHAHQVLQHLADPVAALAEMKRVCRPGGVVAVRDADYDAMTWWPDEPGLHRWLELYRSVARANGGEPRAGRRLRAWARAAGFEQVETSASAWCFAEPDDRAWWADTWAERVVSAPLATRAVELELATRSQLVGMADAWRRWAHHPDGCFLVVHGEILARP
jgi:ubiquinone/menaquinone biosynthesis C-methylase UbiE